MRICFTKLRCDLGDWHGKFRSTLLRPFLEESQETLRAKRDLRKFMRPHVRQESTILCLQYDPHGDHALYFLGRVVTQRHAVQPGPEHDPSFFTQIAKYLALLWNGCKVAPVSSRSIDSHQVPGDQRSEGVPNVCIINALTWFRDTICAQRRLYFFAAIVHNKILRRVSVVLGLQELDEVVWGLCVQGECETRTALAEVGVPEDIGLHQLMLEKLLQTLSWCI